MSKINIDRVSLEVIGNNVYLTMPSEYTLTINSKAVMTNPISHTNLQYNLNNNTSSLGHQIDQVEKSGNGPWNK